MLESLEKPLEYINAYFAEFHESTLKYSKKVIHN